MPQSATASRDQPPIPGEELSVALALVNTRLNGPDGRRDLLADPADARVWLSDHGLTDSAPIDAPEVAALLRLREAIRTLFSARLAGTPDDAADAGDTSDAENAGDAGTATEALSAINAALAAAPCVTSLVWDANGPRVTQQRRSRDPFAKVLAALAADAAQLLAGPHAERLAQCEAHSCIRMFIRTHAARHVCSTRCGDRVRAARHYARKRERERERGRDQGQEQGQGQGQEQAHARDGGHAHDRTLDHAV